MKQLLFFIMMIFAVPVKAQLTPLTAKEKARMDSLSTLYDNHKKVTKKQRAELLKLTEQDKDYTIYNELNERKREYLENEPDLKMLEGKFLKIDLIDNEPYIFCEFKNKSSQAINIYNARISIHSSDDKSNGLDWSKDSDPDTYLQPDETIAIQCRMRNIAYDKMQFPVTNPLLYNLTVTAVCDKIKLKYITYRTVEFTEKDEETLRLLNEKYK